MKLQDFEQVGELRDELAKAMIVLQAFRDVEGETVPAQAKNHNTLWKGVVRYVDLMPVPKSVAVSAAERELSKIKAKLAELGVEV